MVQRITFNQERLKVLPEQSGVYLMKDSRGEVIYIGKAKSLKARVNSYFNGSDKRLSIPHLLRQVRAIDTLLTVDERQALLLEADLIKKYRPRYNLRLKDDRAYVIVRIDLEQQWPKLDLVRVQEDDGAMYIGPYVFSGELRTLLEIIKRSLPLRTCSDKVLNNRVRPCLEHQIGRCCAPCCLSVDRVQYLAWVEQAIEILKGRAEDVICAIQKEMERASTELRFEDAAVLRDRLRVIEKIKEEQQQAHYGEAAIDVFALYREGNEMELCLLLIRNGRIFDSKSFSFENVAVSSEEAISSLLAQHYSGADFIPQNILVDVELEDQAVHEEVLSTKTGRKVSIFIPQKGAKRRLIELAQRNAKQNFEMRFSGADRESRILKALQEEFSLEQMPRIIECADISHFQGGSTVGSIVCFKDGRPDKSRYRRFRLTQEGKPDDFASMNEILRRHLSRLMEDGEIADLLVIDGGNAQLAQGLAVRKELGITQPPMIALAKKRTGKMPVFAFNRGSAQQTLRKPERVFVEGAKEAVVLDPANEVLHLLERLRNEAHRFAVSFHRAARSKKLFRSALDQVQGIGPQRRLELLREFKSIKAISEVDAEDIARRCRIPLRLAEDVKQAAVAWQERKSRW